MNFKFKDWIFNQLPEGLRKADTYKDPIDQGLLQRYLQNLGTELDDEVVDFIAQFSDILDINQMPEDLLIYLGYNLGSPPRIDGTFGTYRKLLSYIISIYKIKGTVCCYNLLFNLLGLGVVVYEYPTVGTNRYDTGLIYDDDVLYDVPCEPCNLYDLLFWNLNDNCAVPTINPVSQVLLDNIQAIICFIQPIDAKLMNLSQLVNYCEEMPLTADNEVTLTIEEVIGYDYGLEYDGGLTYDTPLAVAINIYNF